MVTILCRTIYLTMLLVTMGLANPIAVGAQSDSDVTLTVWHVWSGDRRPLFREVLDRFEAQNPGIKVEDELVNAGELDEKLITGWAAGVGPDVAMLDFYRQLGFAAAELTLPLDELAERDGTPINELIYPTVAQTIQWKGSTYYVPQLMGNHHFLYYNRELFSQAGLDADAPPETHSQFLDAAKRLTRQSGDGTIEQLGVDAVGGGSIGFFNFHAYLEQLGASLVDLSGRQVLKDFDTAVQVLDWMIDFGDSVAGNALAGVDFISRAGGWMNAIINSDVAMHTSAEYVYYQVKAREPDFPLAMALRPRPDGEPIRTSADPAWGYGISRDTEHVEAAWKLVKWLSTAPDGGGWFVQQQARVSTVPSVNQDPLNFETNPYWHVIISSVENSAASGYRSYGSLDQLFQRTVIDAMQAVTAGEVGSWAALENVRRTLQASLDEWWQEND